MAKLNPAELTEILEAQLPGYRLAEPDPEPDVPAMRPDVVAPPIKTLMDRIGSPGKEPEEKPADDHELVRIVPKEAGQENNVMVIVVSRSDRKILAVQG